MRPEGFQIEELVDPDTFGEHGELCWEFFPDNSLEMLQGIRNFFGVPITVNSWPWGGNFRFRGYRPPSYPAKPRFKGDKNWSAAGSYHRSGRAFDFDVKGLTAAQARKIILHNQDDPLLQWIKRIEDAVNWVHADTGNPPEGRTGIYLFRG